MLGIAGAAEAIRISEEEDDEELVRDLFASIDSDKSKTISMNELVKALEDFHGDSELVAALEVLIGKRDGATEEISIDAFLKTFRELPRVRGERVRWAANLRLEEVLAKHLLKGHVFDGLHGLKRLTEQAAEAHIQEVCSKFGAELPGILREELAKLRVGQTGESAAQRHINSKFVMEGAYVGCFASLDDFYKGPEALIGVPNPKIFEGALKEHTLRANAWLTYRTSNYGLWTCPVLEWYFVVDPFGSSDLSPNWLRSAKYPHTPKDKKLWKQEESKAWLEELLKTKAGTAQGSVTLIQQTAEAWRGDCGREPVPIDTFLSFAVVKREVERAALRREEIVCLRLYTGPMFVLYNASLRGFPAGDVAALAGNKFETTIFAIASGITKLSKVTGIPKGRRLFRGLGGMVLPDHFWRSFPECVVKFHVVADNLKIEAIKDALDAKVEEHDSLKGKDRALPTRMLRLPVAGWSNPVPIQRSGPSEMGSCPDQLAPDAGGRAAACDSDSALIEPASEEGQITGLVRHAADAAAKGESDCLLRVVTESRVVGDLVRMTVALPFSKFDFTDARQTLFKDAVRKLCEGQGKVVVDEVADKPVDFKGGGVSFHTF